MKLNKLTTLFCLLAVFACSKSGKNEAAVEAVFKVEKDVITVAENAPLLKNIKTGEAINTAFRPRFTVSGEVRPLPACYAEIAAPFAGRIVKSHVRAGQKIAAGSPVFEISSPDFSETVKAFLQAKQELALAEKSLARVKSLQEHNTASIKDLEESETDFELKRKEFEQVQAALKIWVSNPENLQAGQPLVVRSPIAGEIVKAEITVGQYVKEDADALAAVADISRVRVIARIREKDIPAAHDIDKISVSPVSQPELQSEGKLVYTGAVIDPETRTIDVIVECANTKQELKPNMFVTADFTGREKQATSIPSAAVLQDEDSRYVIVCEENNRFRKVKVGVESESDGQAIISSGLNVGDRIVTDGAFYFVEAR
jgi:cobalt-zinc-cadmium efflux system membrane fusion protein